MGILITSDFITGIIFFFFILILGALNHYINSSRSITNYYTDIITTTTFFRSTISVIQSIFSLQYFTRLSFSGIILSSCLILSYCFSLCRCILFSKGISETSLAITSNDILSLVLFKRHKNITYKQLSYKFLLHWVYIDDLYLSSSLFITSLYWILFLPLLLYSIIALLDGAYIGGQGIQLRSSSSTSYSIKTLCYYIMKHSSLFVCNLFFSLSLSTLLKQFNIISINSFYGPLPLIMSYSILVFYSNPIIIPELMAGIIQNPITIIEARWIILLINTLFIVSTPIKRLPTDIYSGIGSGLFIITFHTLYCKVKYFIKNYKTRHVLRKRCSNEKLIRFTLRFVEFSVYAIMPSLFPFTTQPVIITPGYNFILHFFRGLLKDLVLIKDYSSELTLWRILYTDHYNKQPYITRYLAKLFPHLLMLLPWTNLQVLSKASRCVGIIAIAQMFFAMNSSIWESPSIGFFIQIFMILRLFTIEY